MSEPAAGWPHLLLSMGVGALVGLVELLGRYRDEPRRVLTGTWAAFWYVTFNALVPPRRSGSCGTSPTTFCRRQKRTR